jgi:hypothetical protein
VLEIDSEAPVSAEMLEARTQQPSIFRALPTNASAAVQIESGVALVGAGPP